MKKILKSIVNWVESNTEIWLDKALEDYNSIHDIELDIISVAEYKAMINIVDYIESHPNTMDILSLTALAEDFRKVQDR